MKLLISMSVLLLTACSGTGDRAAEDSAPIRINVDMDRINDAQPRDEPFSKYGNPSSYSVLGKTYYTLKSNQDFKQQGIASWYGTKFHGRRTSSGETYDMFAMTAAHKTLPLPTYVRVTNLDNGKQIVVKVNDRGPFHVGRIIDLSYVAATKLDIIRYGTGRVEIETIGSMATNSTDGNAVFVQVGAFIDEQNARRVHDKLAAASIDSDIHEIYLDAKQPLYRVRIGPFEQRDDAGEMLRNLENLGVSNARIFSETGE